ncbi:phosphodiesterase [Bradyrhizobium sp. CCGUVB1N3]|uniref:phosphodiesterase n=1 Tax=Bradyrhizobium sp. CCGUVB1N3 TaxID=2949629 RepID=UPI0020B1BDD5|nr:phosphodiesterase [Bradyrhizobium sp. CCGUVB1N3]MCP3476041.1 phosphodiesterase [Bradyrhizobium sp. CCGUVB1N3]
MKIIQITDLHLVPTGDRLFDNDPGERLTACLADVAAHHADAELCVITGDLAHHAERNAYARLREALEVLPMPVRLLMGNHDDRTIFRSVFSEAPVDDFGFIQSVLDTAAGRFLFLDTKRSDSHAGLYCEQRQAWLRARLEEAHGRPIYLFMHHPPLSVHFRPADDIMLDDGAAFGRILDGHSIRHLFFGHVHRPITGSWQNIPFSTLRGLNHQLWLDFSHEQGIPCSMEPPAYAIAFLNADAVVIHTHDFLDTSAKYRYEPNLPVERQVVPIARRSQL